MVALATTQVGGRPTVVSGSFDDTVRVWDADTGARLGAPLTGYTGDFFAVAAGEVSGRTVIASGGKDHTIIAWDLATHSLHSRITVHTEDVKALTTADVDGRALLILASADGTIRFWDLGTGQPLGPPLVGHGAQHIYGLAVSGDLLVSAGGTAPSASGTYHAGPGCADLLASSPARSGSARLIEEGRSPSTIRRGPAETTARVINSMLSADPVLTGRSVRVDSRPPHPDSRPRQGYR